MRNMAAGLLVFSGGFAIMVLEIIGARYLARDFGSSFYVWVSQIGMIMTALALGYYAGGALGDRWQRLRWLGVALVPAGILTMLIPNYSGRILDAIVMRHPLDQPIPALWLKLDPAIGSAVVFFLPCFVLATLGPCLIRLSSHQLSNVGRISGMIFAASTVGSICGVFVSGYVLLDQFKLSTIFRITGAMTVLLGCGCWWLDPWFRMPSPSTHSSHS
jgi:MFS family permease